MPDHYSYPNSDVLINKLGITEHDQWKAVEVAGDGMFDEFGDPATLDQELNAARERRDALRSG